MKYFDYAATCPLDRDAADIFIKASTEYFGNSQSLHEAGSAAANLLESCRQEFARLLDVEEAGVYFTSGGSEGNYLGIMALLSAKRKNGRHIITGAAEHSSVYNLMKKLEGEGWEVTFLPMDEDGIIKIDTFIKAVRPETVLVSIQHGNPEIGTLQPIQNIAGYCRSNGILIHSDFVQSFGKISMNSLARSVDALSISGHKFYGPKGTGVAYVNPKLAWKPYIDGTVHEKGFRPGTVNVPGIAAMTAAAQKAHSLIKQEHDRLKELRTIFADTLTELKSPYTIFGSEGDEQLPGIVGMALKGVEGQFVLLECDRKEFAISTGTACHTGLLSPAKTMAAMGINGKEAKEFFRISFGRKTAASDVVELGKLLASISGRVAAV
ncbi:IscS subfamily cysteine desulfurase [Bacillus sp. ISL-35]|uniref:IscS subfamily cysteine desulfurase n=1 Tax=Bacillus sp. ISL-35 TaxID=2819122 RepID=UPI001BE9AF79|nr:IscS subfamily cysteine desulfurase [Bacillus sp. ISL-35]MBT2681679.1 IscS subfamily cysteine desulfurase [Bacillus sp. ISL-35]MBT2702285.1 IscS subfamily cysteine desulfurase [Chryseobacterium sp. ISL-80]